MATKDVRFHNNTITDHKTVNLCVVSYEIFAAEREVEATPELNAEAQARGLRAFETDYKNDEAYNPYPVESIFETIHFQIVFGSPLSPTSSAICGSLKTKGIFPT